MWKELDYSLMTESEKQMLVSEVNLLRELKHKHIVRYVDRIINRTKMTLYIVMEYCEGGDLASYITKTKREGYDKKRHSIGENGYHIHHCSHVLFYLQHTRLFISLPYIWQSSCICVPHTHDIGHMHKHAEHNVPIRPVACWVNRNSTVTYVISISITVEPLLEDHPISQEMWSLKTRGLWWQIKFYGNVGSSARNMWSFKTGGLSWQWSLKTGFTVIILCGIASM